VGYYSSSVLAACPKSFRRFFERGGKIQVVASPKLSVTDAKAIHRGFKEKHHLIRKDFLSSLKRGKELDVLSILSLLVANGKFDIKIAVTKSSASSIYHEKLGIFTNTESSAEVVFSGSANETYKGVTSNFEQVDIFRSWKRDERDRVSRKTSAFKRLWTNSTPNLEVYTFPESTRRGILKLVDDRRDVQIPPNYGNPESGRESVLEVSPLGEVMQVPSHIDLYDHQELGVRQWLKGNGRGILEMATGSGKTITSLAAAVKLYDYLGPPLFVVIVCPYLHLVDQWMEEARNFGLDPLQCTHGKQEWYEDLQVKIFNTDVKDNYIGSAIVTNKTFMTHDFQKCIKDINSQFMLIADEVHNLGSGKLRSSLPDNANYRLGLSATPERWFDERGTEALVEYFGPTLVHYTLEDALADGVLCPYHYVPHLVELTDSEIAEYTSLTKQIAKAFHSERGKITKEPSGKLKHLLIRRARLTATARNKLKVLQREMKQRRDTKHTLVYCGDGRVEEDGSEKEMRQIRAATRMLGKELEMRVATYTAETSTQRRKELRKQFADGQVQCLVAIRCLDEGVDIPETETAFILASSSNPRQFIQRRGRVLRTAPGKHKAEIHDMIVVPPERFRKPSSDHYRVTRKLFGKELDRVEEFAGLAENGPEAMGRLLDIRDQLNLLDRR